ncbi:MAG: hypothetical protein A2Z29_00620 [Chloroflexi bacterium RBG_16_56_11]|nr:MAG: hypothetical protein A2Z29_00620 [Chloroflexi bacterium RBG_16_56_11]
MKDTPGKRRPAGYRPGIQSHREEGTIFKDWGGRLPVALIYPNSYFLGMSNLGIHAIYRILNNHPMVVCERIFLEPGVKAPPVSLESGRPLSDFAVLAFSVSYELDYFNVVRILENSGIPLYAADRDEKHPLVIAGGPCITANPLPMSPFFDCLCIGEAEPILPAMLPVLFEGIGGWRQGLLKSLAALPGIYVPGHPPKTVARQWAASLDDFATTSVLFTPDTELGDMYLIEVERGCQRGCRFCLVGAAFSPMRFRSLDMLVVQAKEGLHYRKRIGLVGPAVTDHPRIKDLLDALNRMGAEIAASSLRISALSGDIIDGLARGKTRTITIAPETGSARLRRVINKTISDDEILEVADRIAAHRFHQLKLYFIIGLPTETDDDTEDIIKLILKIKNTLEERKSGARIVVNIAPFVPKAGTPFQWLPMAPRETLRRRFSLLREAVSRKGVRLNEESPAWSEVQGVLARGDTKVARAIADVKDITLAGWRRAVEKNHLDIDYYVNQRWDTARPLPWSFIDSRTGVERLCAELERALRQ